MTKLFEKVLAKTTKLEKENFFLKDTCEQQKHLLYVISCSHEELKLTHEKLSVAHENLVLDHALLTNKLSSKGIKTSESSSHRSKDQLQNVANSCDVGKKHVSTSCDDLLSIPCSSQLDACTTSMSCETKLLKENNELKNEVKYLSNKIERWIKSKVTLETTHTNAATPMPPCQGVRAGCGITQCEGDSSHSSHHLQQSLGSICLHSHVLRRQS